MVKALIHYGEIGLKGKNIGQFEKKLMDNIRVAAAKEELELGKVKKEQKRIIAEFEDGKEDEIVRALRRVFGIRYFSFITEVEAEIGEIRKTVSEMMQGSEVAFKTRRVDKSFPLTSPEVNKELGEEAHAKGIKVNYSSDSVIHTEIMQDKALIYGKRYEGFGGLPVGTSGRVLCLLSGGIDSPVAAWNLMRRGARVDYLHVHSFSKNQEAEKSKIVELRKEVDKYQQGSKLYLVPYSTYEMETLEKQPGRYDLILFKHYILKLAEAIAEKEGYDAIVTGDNLAQVASQTMENLKAAGLGVKTEVFRPLLTYEKEEIINLAKKIGTYDISIEAYKDCCSILTKNPTTKTKIDKFKEVLEKVNVDELVEKSIKEMGVYEI